MVYEYASEDDKRIDLKQANERNRVRTTNRYVKRIKYGNRQPLLLDITKPSFRKPHTEKPDFSSVDWMFEVVFDYGEGHYSVLPLDESKKKEEQHQYVSAAAVLVNSEWLSRPDPFSTYRAGYEVRTYRRCHRVLMFHKFPELGTKPYLLILSIQNLRILRNTSLNMKGARKSHHLLLQSHSQDTYAKKKMKTLATIRHT
jgi:hypothetical protein